MSNLRSIVASAYAATTTIAVVTGVTIAAELVTPFKTWIAGFTGHHWTTKSVLSIVVFALCFVVCRSIRRSASPKHARISILVLEVAVLLGTLALIGFFTYEYLAG